MAKGQKRDWSLASAEGAIVLLAIGMAFGAGVLGFFLGRHTGHSTSTTAAATTPVDPSVAAGAHDFVQFACAKCHGVEGQGGVSPYVPALKNAGQLTPATLRHIINHGLGESANPTRPYMPVWGAVISDRQVSDQAGHRAGSIRHHGLVITCLSKLDIRQRQDAICPDSQIGLVYPPLVTQWSSS